MCWASFCISLWFSWGVMNAPGAITAAFRSYGLTPPIILLTTLCHSLSAGFWSGQFFRSHLENCTFKVLQWLRGDFCVDNLNAAIKKSPNLTKQINRRNWWYWRNVSDECFKRNMRVDFTEGEAAGSRQRPPVSLVVCHYIRGGFKYNVI